MKILLSIGGASGSIYGIRLLEELIKSDVEVHLVVSDGAKKILKHETVCTYDDLKEKANICYENGDLFAAPASGSFHVDGMIVAPCSIKHYLPLLTDMVIRLPLGLLVAVLKRGENWFLLYVKLHWIYQASKTC